MTFWTDNNFEPKQNFKWKIVLGGDQEISFYATSVTKPNFQVQTKKFKLINIEETFPSNVTWSPVKITFIDSVDNEALESVLYTFKLHGLNVEKRAIAHNGISKQDNVQGIDFLEIHVLNSKGETVEKWDLYNVLPSQLEMSNLDYKNDDLSTYTLTLNYDWATMNEPTQAPDLPEPAKKIKDKIASKRQTIPASPTNDGMTADSSGERKDSYLDESNFGKTPDSNAGQKAIKRNVTLSGEPADIPMSSP